MTHTLYEASNSSQNPFAKGVLKSIADTDQLLSQLMFVPKSGESFSYSREKDLGNGGVFPFVAPDHASLGESSATTERVTVPMRIMAENVDVMDFADQQMSEFNAQRAMQLRQKLKKLGRNIGQKLITGSYSAAATTSAAVAGLSTLVPGPNQDSTRHGPGSLRWTLTGTLYAYRAPGDRTYGPDVVVAGNGTFTLLSDNPNRTLTITKTGASPVANLEVLVSITATTNEWDGLLRLSEQRNITSTAANGDPLTLELMDRMIDEEVKVEERRVFVMPSKLLGKFYSLVRAIPGAREEVTTLPAVNGPVPAYRGIPILKNDWIPVNEAKGASTTLTSLFLLSLDPSEGLWMGAGQAGGTETVDIDPQEARLLGIQVKEIGSMENKDAHRTRVTFYGTPALGSELAVIRASEIIR